MFRAGDFSSGPAEKKWFPGVKPTLPVGFPGKDPGKVPGRPIEPWPRDKKEFPPYRPPRDRWDPPRQTLRWPSDGGEQLPPIHRCPPCCPPVKPPVDPPRVQTLRWPSDGGEQLPVSDMRSR